MDLIDPELDNTTSAAKTGSIGSLRPKSLGSLVKSARGKELNRAKWTLVIVGLIYIAYYGIQYTMAEQLVDAEFQKQLNAAGPGAQIDPAARQNSILGVLIITAGGAALGLAMLALGTLVKRFPVALLTIALVLFIGYHGTLGYFVPITLLDLWVVKVVVLFGLVKGLKAALGEQREARSLAGPA